MPASFRFFAFSSSLTVAAPGIFGVGSEFGGVGGGLFEKYGICKALKINQNSYRFEF
jgi:hypothetical protein